MLHRRPLLPAHRLTVAALACAAVVAFAPVNASATPVTWNLNATITNGTASGTAVGSFVYDADTNVYSSIAITTTLPAATFNEIGGAFFSPSNTSLQLIDNFVPGANTDKPTITMSYLTPLTNLGGSVNVGGFSFAGFCGDGTCDTINFVNSSGVVVGGIVSGQLTGTPVVSTVPEPATLVLCSTGLIGAVVRRWRQRRA
jgi:hypothetical protein